jgi:hypothetical protein
MASIQHHPVDATQRFTIKLSGSFAPNGASAVSAASNKGRGFTVARTGTGQFTLTLTDKWAELVSANATLQLATPADSQVQWGACDVVSAKTLVLTVLTAGVAADVAANAGNRINFDLCLRSSLVA